MSEWKKFEIKKYSPPETREPPYDSRPFLACIWGNDSAGGWVGQAVYSRHYDAGNRCAGKYEFFYVTTDPEHEGWEIRIEEQPFPISHWMPLPEPPKPPHELNHSPDLSELSIQEYASRLYTNRSDEESRKNGKN